jgi:hypothetical protein
VLLVEGNSSISTAIKYLTQSTWSHAALYVGPRPDLSCALGGSPCVVEADTVEGVRAIGLSQFAGLHVRVCRPASLSEEETQRLVEHATAPRIGLLCISSQTVSNPSTSAPTATSTLGHTAAPCNP